MSVPRARYLIARTESDYEKVQQLLKGTEFERVSVTYPTIMAYRGEELVGVLGTKPSDQAVICGPLYVKTPAPVGAFVAERLINVYEGMLSALGVQSYVFYIDKKNYKQRDIIRRIGLRPYTYKGGKFWYSVSLK